MLGYRNHGWRHDPEKGSDPVTGTASVKDFYSTPIMLPILVGGTVGADTMDTLNFDKVTADSTVRFGAVLQNDGPTGAHTPAVGDYFTMGATLGPTGSIWGLIASYKATTDGGRAALSLGSVASPNPNRAGTDDAGTLEEYSGTTYHQPNGAGTNVLDCYAAAPADADSNSLLMFFRIAGAAGDPYTGSAGTDTYTGYPKIDGGPGFYRLKVEVTGKGVSSTGYRIALTGLAWVRLDDYGYR